VNTKNKQTNNNNKKTCLRFIRTEKGVALFTLSSFYFPREQPNHERIGFNIESLLLRGCTIRNTEVAIGIVIYAGKKYILSR